MPERRRRGQGEGAIYQLADGTWRGAVDLGWHNGRRRRKYVRRPTRAETVNAVRALVAEVEQGRVIVGRAPTVAQWLQTYLGDVAAGRVRPSTLHRYEEEINLHIIPSLGRIRLDRLRPQHLSEFYRDKSQRLSPGSVRRLHAVMRHALNVAVRWQLITTNPALAVEPPPVRPAELSPWSESEAQQFLSVVRSTRLEARWLLALAAGLRQGEALGLAWRDVDIEAGLLRVRRALQRQPDGGLMLVPPKTPRSRRVVPLSKTVADALRDHLIRQQEEYRSAERPWDSSGLVFVTGNGTPIHPRNDYRMFVALMRAAGIRRVRLHDLRHTTASLLLTQGVPARVVMELLGHSQVSLTLDTYTHVAPAVTRAAADGMEKALWPAS